MVRIGHASQDENKKAKGGKAGDNNGKEVCVRNWYKKPWHTLLRPKDGNVAERMAYCCEVLCNSNYVGYDQNQRNSLRKELLKVNWIPEQLRTLCETDCSAFMSVCAEASGVAMYGQYISGNAPTTANMVNKFYATGMFDVLTDKSYLNDYTRLRRGDILVCNGHTVMVLDDGPKKEDKPTLCKGSKGSWVKIMQNRLSVKGYTLKPDGDFGSQSMMCLVAFQGEMGLVKDGICGPKSWEKLFL